MIFCFDEFEFDSEHLELRRGGQLVESERLVARLLYCLLKNPGRLVSKNELVDEVWEGRAIADNAITVSMARLRRLLGHRRNEREFVSTSYGRGYRFLPDVTTRSVHREPRASGEASEARSKPPLLVGREHTLARLKSAWSETCAQHGRCILLMGEPGIGKTFALEAFTRELAETGARIAWGFCREAGDTPPLWPWLRLLREVFGSTGLAPFEQELGSAAARELQALLSLSSAPNPVVQLARTDWQGPKRHLLFDASVRALKLAAAESAWLLIIDDLHRADAASLELLSHLLAEISQSRLLVVATLRHWRDRRLVRAGTHLSAVLGHRNAERVTLARLEQDDVAAYVRASIDDPDGSLGRAVYRKSEGNPFFMAELLRVLRDGDPAERALLAIPQAALDPIGKRLAQLEPDVRAILSAASVLGRSFELPNLSAITGRDLAQLMASLDDALEAEVLVAAPDSTTAFAFGHELMRAMLYDALPPHERRSLHAVVAKVLERRKLEGEAIPDSELAHHAYSALPEGDLRKAVQACRAAAAAAAAVFAGHDVIRYTRHALEALDLMENPSIRLRMNLWFMISIFARGYSSHESSRAIRETARLAQDQRDGGMLVRLAIMHNLHPGLPPVPGAGPLLLSALNMLPEQELGSRALAQAGLACASPNAYSKQRSQELITQAVSDAREHAVRGALYSALIYQLYLFGGPDHESDGAQTIDELEMFSQRSPELTPLLQVDLALHRALGGLQNGREVAPASVDHAVACCRRLEHRELMWHCERFQALQRINLGAWKEGMQLLESLHRRAEHEDLWGSATFRAFDRCVTFGELGMSLQPDESLRSTLRFEAAEPPSIWSLKVRALANCGWHDDARAMLRAVPPAELADLPCDRDHLGTLGHLARASLQLSANEYIDALYRLLTRYSKLFSIGISFLSEGSVEQLLGMLAHSRGRYGQAVTHLEAALGANERAGLPLRAHEARVSLARSLLERGGETARRRALELAHEARSQADQLGTARSLADVNKLLGILGAM